MLQLENIKMIEETGNSSLEDNQDKKGKSDSKRDPTTEETFLKVFSYKAEE